MQMKLLLSNLDCSSVCRVICSSSESICRAEFLSMCMLNLMQLIKLNGFSLTQIVSGLDLDTISEPRPDAIGHKLGQNFFLNYKHKFLRVHCFFL